MPWRDRGRRQPASAVYRERRAAAGTVEDWARTVRTACRPAPLGGPRGNTFSTRGARISAARRQREPAGPRFHPRSRAPIRRARVQVGTRRNPVCHRGCGGRDVRAARASRWGQELPSTAGGLRMFGERPVTGDPQEHPFGPRVGGSRVWRAAVRGPKEHPFATRCGGSHVRERAVTVGTAKNTADRRARRVTTIPRTARTCRRGPAAASATAGL